jgi:hypothetical protein
LIQLLNLKNGKIIFQQTQVLRFCWVKFSDSTAHIGSKNFLFEERDQ